MSTWIKEPVHSLLKDEHLLFVGDNKGGLLPRSQQCNVNFLWQENNIYVMDNHLAAGWCWLHECCPIKEYNFLHVDQHTDDNCYLPEKRIRDDFSILCDKIEFDDYCNLQYKQYGELSQLFQCEHYIRPISTIYPLWFSNCIFATHQRRNLDFVKKMVDNKQLVDTLHTPRHIESCDVVSTILGIKYSDKKWIVNIDLDYLFKEECQILENKYFQEVSSALSKVRDNIRVMTVALSTPWCKGLRNSLEILSCLAKDIPELQNFSLSDYL